MKEAVESNTATKPARAWTKGATDAGMRNSRLQLSELDDPQALVDQFARQWGHKWKSASPTMRVDAAEAVRFLRSIARPAAASM